METIANIGAVQSPANLESVSVKPDNASALQASSDNASSSESFVLSKPPYVSPAIRLDYETQQVVLEYRDSSTGEVTRQIPSGGQVEAYSQAQSLNVSQLQENQSQVTGSVEVSISNQASSASYADIVNQAETTSSGPELTQAQPADNRVQTSGSLGPQAPLGNGDTSSFA